MSEYGVDTKDLEVALFKENDLLLLGVNGGGDYVPLRVIARIERPNLYDTVEEGLLPSGLAASTSTDGISGTTYQEALQLSSAQLPGHPTDVFDIAKFRDTVFQMFLGIDPPATKIFLQQPFRSDQGAFPVINFRPQYAQSGWWDGFLSPFRRPSPKAEIIVLPSLSIALAFQNVESQPEYPQLLFWINDLRVATITDVDLIYDMITIPGKARIKTVGGLAGQNYNLPASPYGIEPIHLNMDKTEIAKAVSP